MERTRNTLAATLSCCAVALALAACSRSPEPSATATEPAADAAAPAPESPAATALVALGPTEGNNVSGTLTLTQEAGAVAITGTVGNLTPGSQHGFHVHEKGDCSAPDASSAGAHFNPSGAEHGNPSMPGASHLGDMLNLQADEQGNAQVEVRIAGATLRDGGPNDLVGRGIVVHAQPDDYTTQPSGNSGGRIACGAIG